MTETWRDVFGWEGLYQVSSLGRVKTIRANIILKQSTASHRGGYKSVTMSLNGYKEKRFVHHLVLEAFSGLRGLGEQGCHCDGDPTNNSAANLRWDTAANNTKDKLSHGTYQSGENNPFFKLTNAQVAEIRERAKTETQTALAKEFKVSRNHVSGLVRMERRVIDV